MQKEKCLSCYQVLNEGEVDFHSACSKKFFGTAVPPIIDFRSEQLETLAKQTILKRIAVTGVQPKLSLDIKKQKDEISRLTIVGLLHGGYILKPPSKEFSELPQNEDLTMHLADIAKIKTALHSLIRLPSGELAYITKRFDRDKKGNKIAMEDLCQLTETQTEYKYRSSVEKVAKTIYKYTTNKGFEQIRLFELVLFCYLTGNADMHLKNFALIENSLDEYELSPAYDLLSTALVTREDNEEFALTINGKKNRLTRRDFDVLAVNMKINPTAFLRVYTRFSKLLPKWIAFVEVNSFISYSLKREYIELLKERHKNLFADLPNNPLSSKK